MLGIGYIFGFVHFHSSFDSLAIQVDSRMTSVSAEKACYLYTREYNKDNIILQCYKDNVCKIMYWSNKEKKFGFAKAYYHAPMNGFSKDMQFYLTCEEVLNLMDALKKLQHTTNATPDTFVILGEGETWNKTKYKNVLVVDDGKLQLQTLHGKRAGSTQPQQQQAVIDLDRLLGEHEEDQENSQIPIPQVLNHTITYDWEPQFSKFYLAKNDDINQWYPRMLDFFKKIRSDQNLQEWFAKNSPSTAPFMYLPPENPTPPQQNIAPPPPPPQQNVIPIVDITNTVVPRTPSTSSTSTKRKRGTNLLKMRMSKKAKARKIVDSSEEEEEEDTEGDVFGKELILSKSQISRLLTSIGTVMKGEKISYEDAVLLHKKSIYNIYNVNSDVFEKPDLINFVREYKELLEKLTGKLNIF